MKSFKFLCWGTKDEPNTRSTVSTLSMNSTFTDRDTGQSASVFDSQTVSGTSSESTWRSSIPNMSLRPSHLRVFTFAELKSATNNFSRSAMLGEGGFGCVYKGFIESLDDPSQKIEVAVKQLGKRGLQGHKEWVTEVNVLGVVEHPNLVKLLGYCAEDDERGIQRLLIYEYMPNTSVENLLNKQSETTLSWGMRLKIAQDAARGLAYLHEGMGFQIIFRDFKSSNILLDDQWRAKLSDFGLARLGPSEGLTHVSTAVVGTIGYAAPEYIQTGHLTCKSDVWSYGVFLYELITGRRPLDRNRPKNEQKLLEWVKPYLSKTKKFKLILDPRLKGKDQVMSAQKLAMVANRCLIKNAPSRPKMSEVLEMVNKIVGALPGAESPLIPELESSKRHMAHHAEESKEDQNMDKNTDALLTIKYSMESFLKAERKGKVFLIIESDSNTAVKWIKDYDSRPRKLWPMLEEIDTLIPQIGTVMFKIVLNGANDIEDSLVKDEVVRSYKFWPWW